MTVALRATYGCDWWSPEEDSEPLHWGGFCDPNNPWGTAYDDPPGDPTCSECHEEITWRHDYYGGSKVRGAVGWIESGKLNAINSPYEHLLPDHCEHRPEWPNMDTDDREPIEITLDLWEAAEFIHDFPGGVWDFREGEHDQDFRTGVYTEVTLHVDGPGAGFAFAWAAFLGYLQDKRLREMRAA